MNSLCESDENNEIYADFHSNEFLDSDFTPIVEQGQIEGAQEELAAVAQNELTNSDRRPRAFDHNTKSYVLIDTGAACTAFPKHLINNSATLDPTKRLQAVNGSAINTFGTQTIKIKLGKHVFTHPVVLAEISGPVIGFDFLTTHRLDLIWHRGGGCSLSSGRKKVQLTLDKINPSLLGLATLDMPIDFKDWSHKHKTTEKDPIPEPYQRLLAEFPNIDKPDFKTNPAHGIIHTIKTGNHPPCKAKLRRLLPGSPKEQLGKKRWLELEKLGVIERIKAGDNT